MKYFSVCVFLFLSITTADQVREDVRERLSRILGIIVECSNSSDDQRIVIAFVGSIWRGANALNIGLSMDQTIRPPRTVGLATLSMLKAELPAEILLQPAYFSLQPHEWHAPNFTALATGLTAFVLDSHLP